VVLIRARASDFCSGADLSGLHEEPKQARSKHDGCRKWRTLFVEMRRHPHRSLLRTRRALAGECGLATRQTLSWHLSRKIWIPEVNIGFGAPMVMAILRRSVFRETGVSS